MAISEIDIKLLWGRAGGMCSKPDCTGDLTVLVDSGNYIVGEMAHVIGRKPTARRSTPEGGPDSYDNLILLCPTHHTHIDKSPEGTFPPKLLYKWKCLQEEAIRSAGCKIRLQSFRELQREITRLLASNRALFKAVGPHSVTAITCPSSNLFSIWELRRLDRIVPNNRKILNLLDANASLIPASALEIVETFRVHVEAYERHVVHRLDSYPLFPVDFEQTFSKDE